MPAAFRIKKDAGGVLRMNVKLLSCTQLQYRTSTPLVYRVAGMNTIMSHFHATPRYQGKDALIPVSSHLEDCDLHGDDLAHLVLGRCVVLFAEGHDIDTLRGRVTAESWAASVRNCRLHPTQKATWLSKAATLAPSAGPTGGAGFALPASNASLMMAVTAGTVTLWLIGAYAFAWSASESGREHARLRAPPTFAALLGRRGCHCNDSPLHQAGSPRPHRATPKGKGAAQRMVAQAAAEEGARCPLSASALACHRNSVHPRLRGRQPRQSSHGLECVCRRFCAKDTLM